MTVIILAGNEEVHIERAISSAASIAEKIFVVDSFSTDRTLEIATRAGAYIVQHVFVNYAQQFQWALDNLTIDTDWVMRLDADEVLGAELVHEIAQQLPLLPAEITGVNLRRRHIFLGRWIKYGGRYPLTLLRIWRKGTAKIEQRWMDEHMALLQGSAVNFKYDFSDWNLNDVTFFIAKHNKYSTREAIDRLNDEFKLFARDEAVSRGASTVQAQLKRLAKEGFYNRLPFGMGPLSYFLWRYIVQLGFLDGREGLIYHFLQGFWYRFLVEVRVFELRRAVSHLRDRDRIKAELVRLTRLLIE